MYALPTPLQSVKPPFKPNAQTYEMYRSTSILGIKFYNSKEL